MPETLKKKSHGVLILGAGLALLLGEACGAPTTPSPSSNQPQSPALEIVTTTTIPADWARQVAGERASVESLLPPGVDPHTFDPSPGQVAAIARADLIFLNGLGLEPSIEGLVKEATGQVVRLGEAANPLPTSGADASGGAALDPHYWLDSQRVVLAVEVIRDAMIVADPAAEEEYRQAATDYITELQAFDEWARGQVSALPLERRLLVTNHDSFQYFARRYGFHVVGAVVPGTTTEREPSPAELAGLVEDIRATGVTAVFLETTSSPKLARSLAQEAGVRVIDSLYTASLGPEGSGAESYLDLMRYDVRVIVEALR